MPMPSDHAALVVWPGRGSLPSLDPACLVAIALASLASHSDGSVKLEIARLSLHTGVRCPPYFQTIAMVHGQEIYDNSTILAVSADTAALVAFMHAELRPLVEYTAFGLPKNWLSIFRNIYAEACMFPLNVLWPDLIRRKATSDSQTWHFPSSIESEADTQASTKTPLNSQNHTFAERVQAAQKLRQKGRERLRVPFRNQALLRRADSVFGILNAALSRRHDGHYYAAEHATVADAISCAYLSVILYNELPDKTMGEHLESQYPRLAAHTITMSKILF